MRRITSFVLIFCIMIALAACGSSEGNDASDVSGSSDVSSQEEVSGIGSETSSEESGTVSMPEYSKGTAGESSKSTSSKAESSKASTSSASGNSKAPETPTTSKTESSTSSKPGNTSTPTTENPKPTSNVKYTDGNIYVMTDDRNFIIKIDPKFSGHEVIYESNPSEVIYQPTYRNGAVFFLRECDGEPAKIYRVDVSTKKQTTVFFGDQISDFIGDWTIAGDQIFVRNHVSGDKITYYMCNLDGSNLRKSSASNVYALSYFSNEYNGKVYMVCTNSSSFNVTFYEMNIDGTGFKQLFTKNHYLCNNFEMLGVVNGEIYYHALATRDEVTTDGLYKVKLDGSGQKQIQRATMLYAATDGNLLYLTPSDTVSGISRIEKNDTVSNNIALKGTEPYSLTYLHNGFMYAECATGYILSVPDLKAYKIADYSPPSPFANYKNGFNILSLPSKTTYKVGEGFDTTGFDHVYYNKYAGTLKNVSDSITFVTKDGVTLTQGRPFTTSGKKEIQIRYNGKTVATYTITVNK
jgi:hypothetical protein